MKLSNAIKKLEKAGFVVTSNSPMRSIITGAMLPPNIYTGKRRGYRIELYRNGEGDALAVIRLASIGDRDEIESDYFAGSHMDSVTQAIRNADRWEAMDRESAQPKAQERAQLVKECEHRQAGSCDGCPMADLCAEASRQASQTLAV